MNWAMPRAPARLTAKGLKPDSAYSWAAISAADTFQRLAARAIVRAYAAGTKEGTALRPSATAGAERGLRPYPQCHGSHAYRCRKWKRPALRRSHAYAEAGPRSSSVP